MEEAVADKLSRPISFETAFGVYLAQDILGHGGSGIVYGGTSDDDSKVAIKLLSKQTATSDKRRRFRNEIAFLRRNKHPNIVSVTDHGVANNPSAAGPFYVMRRYDCNLRDLTRARLTSEEVLPLFQKILDGVEAAHLQGVIHRDLKPENVLFDRSTKTPAIADFGIASFTDDIVATLVETQANQRLANFQYAAPEQRMSGKNIGPTADIYALGLMLNEMFTGDVPHGTEYRLIGQAHAPFGYLDAVVAKMIRQSSSDRYTSIAEVKGAIGAHHAEFLSLQKLRKIDGIVIPAGQVDDPLAHVAPKIIDAEWNGGTLRMKLDQPVHQRWVHALQHMGNYTSYMGLEPHRFQFSGDSVSVAVTSQNAQLAIDSFKQWLPKASSTLKENLEAELRAQEAALRANLARERAAEEERLKVTRNLKF
jgi:serine/threonine protein kinase